MSENNEAKKEYIDLMRKQYERGVLDNNAIKNLKKLGISFDKKDDNKALKKEKSKKEVSLENIEEDQDLKFTDGSNGGMTVSPEIRKYKKINDDLWKPKSVVNHTDEFFEWINSFTFGKFTDKLYYEKFEAYKRQAQIWMNNFQNPYEFNSAEKRKTIILNEYDKIERNTLYFAMQYYDVADGSVRAGRFKYVPKEHNALIFYLLDCGYLFCLGKPRQIFATTTVGIYIWKKLITQENFYMTFISEDEKTAIGILNDKIKNSYRYLPRYIAPFELDRDWQKGLKCGKGKRKGDMGIPNSRIEALPPTKTAINSSAPQEVFVDEAASVPDLIPMIMEQRPTLYMDLNQDGNLQIKRRIMLWSTGTTSTKGKMAYHALWENIVKLWNEKEYKSALFVPVFFSWHTRCNAQTYEEARNSYFQGTLEDLQGYSIEERKQMFHMHYPDVWTDMFAMVSNKVVPADLIKKQKDRIRNLPIKDRPIYGRFEPIYDYTKPLDEVFKIPFKIIGARFIPHDDNDEDYTKITCMMKHKPERWENRYFQGTDPVQTDTGQSLFSSTIWDDYKKSPACILNYRPDYDPRDAYIQSILMSIYYDPNPIGAKIGVPELIENNIGTSYYKQKELLGFDRNIIYNKELPKEIHGGGTVWGIDTKSKKKEYCVTYGLKECVMTYADNIDFDIVYSQLDTYVPIKKGDAYAYQPADKRLYRDDVLDSLSFSYLASKVFNKDPINLERKIEDQKVKIEFKPKHDKYGNYYLEKNTIYE